MLLLTNNAKVFVQEFDNPKRKTKFDLISVYKGSELVNIDSQVPNKVFHEWVMNSGFFEDMTLIKPESKYGNSRFDFYIETYKRKIFVEIKGVTLEENGVARVNVFALNCEVTENSIKANDFVEVRLT